MFSEPQVRQGVSLLPLVPDAANAAGIVNFSAVGGGMRLLDEFLACRLVELFVRHVTAAVRRIFPLQQLSSSRQDFSTGRNVTAWCHEDASILCSKRSQTCK